MAASSDVPSMAEILLDEQLPGPFYGLPSIGVDLQRIAASSVQAGKAGDLGEYRQRFELELLSMKAVWNANLPIHTLPAEILLEVFKCSLVPSEEQIMLRSEAVRHPWARFMGVCRHWCALIRNDTAFWSVVNVARDTSWMQLALRRSRSAPIHVMLPHGRNTDAAVPTLAQHAWRVKYLSVDVKNSSAVQSLMGCSYPLLLKISAIIPCFPFQGMALRPVHFSGGVCPRLESLRLSHCSLSWTKSLLSNLHYLCLISCQPPPQLLSFAQFLDVLEHGQRLQVLQLGNFLSTSLSAKTSVPCSRLVTLPKLSKIECRDIPAHVARLVSHLRTLAPACDYHLTGICDDLFNVTASYSSLLLPSQPGGICAPVLRAVTSASITAGAEENVLFLESPSGDRCTLQLECADDDYDDWWGEWLEHGLESLAALLAPLEKPLISLKISGPLSCVSGPTWDLLFDSVPALESLALDGLQHEERVEDSFPTDLVSSLSAPATPRAATTTDEDRETPGVRCPALADLEIVLEAEEWGESALEEIVACLDVRAESGARGLRSLRLHPMLESSDAGQGRGVAGEFQHIQRQLLHYTNNLERW